MSDERPNPPFEGFPDLERLNRDVNAIKDAILRFEASADARDTPVSVGELCLWSVSADLVLRSNEAAAGVSILLACGAIVPVIPLIRQVYESVITLRYLWKQRDPQFEAQVAVAHEYARACWVWEKLNPP